MSETRDEALARLRAAYARFGETALANDAPDEILSQTADAAEEFAGKLEQLPPGRVLWGYVSTHSARVRGALVLGLAHTDAGPGRLSQAGDHFEGVVELDGRYEGPPGAVHGGHIAWLFDEACAAAQAVATGHPGRTAELRVSYLAPAPLDRLLHVRASVTTVAGRRLQVHAELRDGETLCATAEAEFAQLRA